MGSNVVRTGGLGGATATDVAGSGSTATGRGLVGCGRLLIHPIGRRFDSCRATNWAAIALGLLTATGAHPDRAPNFLGSSDIRNPNGMPQR